MRVHIRALSDILHACKNTLSPTIYERPSLVLNTISTLDDSGVIHEDVVTVNLNDIDTRDNFKSSDFSIKSLLSSGSDLLRPCSPISEQRLVAASNADQAIEMLSNVKTHIADLEAAMNDVESSNNA